MSIWIRHRNLFSNVVSCRCRFGFQMSRNFSSFCFWLNRPIKLWQAVINVNSPGSYIILQETFQKETKSHKIFYIVLDKGLQILIHLGNIITLWQYKMIIILSPAWLKISTCRQGWTTFGLLGMLKIFLGPAEICQPFIG